MPIRHRRWSLRVELEWHDQIGFGYSGRFVKIHDSEDGRREAGEWFDSQEAGIRAALELFMEKYVSRSDLVRLEKMVIQECPGSWLGDADIARVKLRI